MQGKRNNERIAFAEVAAGIQDHIDLADPIRETGLKILLKINNAKLNGKKRELERFKQKHGEKHPRVMSLTSEFDVQQAFIREATVFLERSQIETPSVNENTWVLHGRVYSKEIKGVPNLTVGLYDQTGKLLESFGNTCTDKTGYFRLDHEISSEKYEKSDGKFSIDGCLKQAFIQIRDNSGDQLYTGKQAIVPAGGKVGFYEIILEDHCKY